MMMMAQHALLFIILTLYLPLFKLLSSPTLYFNSLFTLSLEYSLQFYVHCLLRGSNSVQIVSIDALGTQAKRSLVFQAA